MYILFVRCRTALFYFVKTDWPPSLYHPVAVNKEKTSNLNESDASVSQPLAHVFQPPRPHITPTYFYPISFPSTPVRSSPIHTLPSSSTSKLESSDVPLGLWSHISSSLQVDRDAPLLNHPPSPACDSSESSWNSDWTSIGENLSAAGSNNRSQTTMTGPGSRDSYYFPQHPAKDWEDMEDRRLLREQLQDIYERQKWQVR